MVIVSGGGHRTAKSYERDPAGAAVLHIEFEPQAVAVGLEPPADLDLRTIGATVARGAVEVEFAPPAARPARLELVDLAGRRLAASRGGAMGSAGTARASPATSRPASHFVHLTQDRSSRVVKAVALR